MLTQSSVIDRIALGAKQMGVSLSDEQCVMLADYLALLVKWNKAYNLTAIRDIERMIPLHVLDSLSVVDALADATCIIDVGTGGGLPGIVLAIVYPHKPITLLDSNGKKTRFLVQVKAQLGLSNVTVVNERVERYQPEQLFDAVVSRAFASLEDMVSGCRHFRATGGAFYAMKGQYPVEEIACIQSEFDVAETRALNVPGVDGERHLLRLVPVAEEKVHG